MKKIISTMSRMATIGLIVGFCVTNVQAGQDESGKTYYKSGSLQSEAVQDRNGDIQTKTYYENGRLQLEGIVRGDKLEGPVKEYYESGQPKGEWIFKNGKEYGSYKIYYENGSLKKEGFYKDGKEDGLFKGYYESGQLQTEGTFNEGNPEGDVKIYYKSGQLQYEGMFKNSKLDGSAKEYYENGHVKSDQVYKDGILDGPFNEYYENGQLKKEVSYKGGKEDGLNKVYYESGALQAEGSLRDGKKDGPVKMYYKSGKLQSEGIFKDDEVIKGSVKEYSESGQVKIKSVGEDNASKDQKGLDWFFLDYAVVSHTLKNDAGYELELMKLLEKDSDAANRIAEFWRPKAFSAYMEDILDIARRYSNKIQLGMAQEEIDQINQKATEEGHKYLRKYYSKNWNEINRMILKELERASIKVERRRSLDLGFFIRCFLAILVFLGLYNILLFYKKRNK